MNAIELIKNTPEQFAAPQVACKLTRLLKKSPHSDEIIDLVQCDPALALKILQVCNSAAFKSREPITSLDAAISWLGYSKIFKIVWQLSVGEKLANPLPGYGMEIGALWRHSLTTAIAAEEILKLTNQVPEDGSTAFTAALLHDFGKVMMELNLRNEMKGVAALCQAEKIPAVEAERTLLGTDHAEIGGKILEGWDQPTVLSSAVADHHTPVSENCSPLARLINLADLCTHTMGASYGWGAMYIPAMNSCMASLKVSPMDLQKAMVEVQSRAAEIEVFVSIV